MFNIRSQQNKLIPFIAATVMMTQMTCTQLNAGTVNEKNEKIKINQQFLSLTLWDVIDTIPNLFPLNRKKIETLFEITLIPTRIRASNLESKNSIHLSDGIIIGNNNPDPMTVHGIDLRLSEPPLPMYGFLVLNLSTKGVCIKLEDLKTKYGQLIVEPPISPQPLGLNQKSSRYFIENFSLKKDWGELTFGMQTVDGKPDCLKSVVFNPN